MELGRDLYIPGVFGGREVEFLTSLAGSNGFDTRLPFVFFFFLEFLSPFIILQSYLFSSAYFSSSLHPHWLSVV